MFSFSLKHGEWKINSSKDIRSWRRIFCCSIESPYKLLLSHHLDQLLRWFEALANGCVRFPTVVKLIITRPLLDMRHTIQISNDSDSTRTASIRRQSIIPFGHDDVIKWKQFPRNWTFVRGIHRSPVNSPHKGQWRGALMFSLICVWIND